MESLAQVDLGALLLLLAILLGMLGVVVLLIRLIQIPIRKYLVKRQNNKNIEIKPVENIEEKGF